MTRYAYNKVLTPYAAQLLTLNSRTLISLWPFCLGALYPLGFAPFEYSTLLFFVLMAFFACLYHQTKAFRFGFLFGLGLASTGLSWIYVSIHHYGHLHPLIAAIITLLFISYIGAFYGLMAYIQKHLAYNISIFIQPLIFASIWTLSEWFRAQFLGGFPWLLLGHAAIDSNLQRLLPVVGIYGCGFIICWIAVSIYLGLLQQGLHKISLCPPIILLLLLKAYPIATESAPKSHFSTSIIQANVAMLEKWDEAYFWKNYLYYLQNIKQLLAKNHLIILPEAAISAPSNYMRDELRRIDYMAKNKDSAVILGIPQAVSSENDDYYNGSIALGRADGNYYKQQLVPFGEYVPQVFLKLLMWLNVPIVNTIEGPITQPPIHVFKQKVSSLICYELAYPELLRRQVAQSRVIITMSDDSWFGHSLALYQHLQMARTLAKMSHRSLVFANNNGLSSLINQEGIILSKAPLWQKKNISADMPIFQDITSWVKWGDKPILGLCLILFIFSFSKQGRTKKAQEELTDIVINT